MRAFAGILGFELRHGVRRISTWVYFAIFFAAAFVLTCAEGGAWSGFDLGTSGRLANSPLEITLTVAVLTLLGMPVTAALLGNAVYRDFQTGIHPLFFTSPVPKAAFLAGRYLGAALVNLVVLLSVPLGMLVATAMPMLQPDRIGPTRLDAYLQAFALFAVPNVLFAGALFFGLAALTRQMLPNYIGGVMLLVGWAVAGSQLASLDNRTLAGMLDPFGMRAQAIATQYWTVVERNTLMLPADGVLLYNRLLWVAVGALVLLGVVAAFRFEHPGGARRQVRAAPSAWARGCSRGSR